MKKVIYVKYFHIKFISIVNHKPMSNIIVLKFGGSSQCKTGMDIILRKIQQYQEDGHKIIIVISAVGKTTNNLYRIINLDTECYETICEVHQKFCESIDLDFSIISHLLDELKEDINDYVSKPFLNITQKKLKIISYGEYLASTIVHNFLLKNGIGNIFANAHLFMKNKSLSETIDADTLNIKGEFFCDSHVIKSLIDKTNVVVTQGFIASTIDNKYCVLTRSGSNTSASLIASSIWASRLEIWTDVNGLYTADPRKIEKAKLIPFIKYEVCQEAAAMGSQIIHPFSIKPCEEKDIPIYIKNTFSPDSQGTIINGNSIAKSIDSVYLISSQNDVTTYQITSIDMWEAYGFAYDIFKVFNDEKIDINIVTTSQFSITTTTNEKSKSKLSRAFTKLSKKYKVNVIEDCAIVSIIADNVSHNKNIQKIHEVIDELDEPIYVTHYGSNNLTLSYVVNMSYADKLTKVLHNRLIEL